MPLSRKDFDRIADVIGPDVGAARDALRAYFVESMSKAEAARMAEVSRSAVTKYVAKWETQLGTLAMLEDIDWSTIKAMSKKAGKRKLPL